MVKNSAIKIYGNGLGLMGEKFKVETHGASLQEMNDLAFLHIFHFTTGKILSFNLNLFNSQLQTSPAHIFVFFNGITNVKIFLLLY